MADNNALTEEQQMQLEGRRYFPGRPDSFFQSMKKTVLDANDKVPIVGGIAVAAAFATGIGEAVVIGGAVYAGLKFLSHASREKIANTLDEADQADQEFNSGN